MKLKQQITMIGILGISNAVTLGMVAYQHDTLHKENQHVKQQITELEKGIASTNDTIKSIKTEFDAISGEVGTLKEKVTALEKQPTYDKANNDVEENVELNPVNKQPVGRTSPQPIQEKEKPKESTSNTKEVNVRVSFYTSLASENGGYAGMNAINGKLKLGSISAPKEIPFGSTISIPKMQDYLGITSFNVDDRGGAIYKRDDGVYKLDVYVPQKQGESDNGYFNRVNNMGIVNTKATIYFK